MFVHAKQPFVLCMEFQRNVNLTRNIFIDKFNDCGMFESVPFQFNRPMKCVAKFQNLEQAKKKQFIKYLTKNSI